MFQSEIQYFDTLLLLKHTIFISDDFYPGDDGSAFLTNTGTYLHDYMTSHPR